MNGVRYTNKGHLHAIDDLATGELDKIGAAISGYADSINKDSHSMKWQRTVRWIENILFSAGRQYVDDILISRVANSSDSSVGDLSVIRDATASIPKPTNDLLGRYIETNIALLTENRPRPRVTPKSDADEDQTAAELSELTLEYLWEALNMPTKMREAARLVLNTGIVLFEVAWDPTIPRRIQTSKTKKEIGVELPEGAMPPIRVEREVPVFDEKGRPIMMEKMEYGDIVANLVSAFQFHTPSSHYWENLGWVLKEEFVPIDSLKDKYLTPPKRESGLTVENGWHLDALDDLSGENVKSLALWWWERISELVEGPGPSLYIGSPDYWEGHVTVRTFDRAPSMKWPKGRTVITVGDKVLYDSPKKVGARAYDPRWPSRWHPYVRYRWEGQTGSIYGRSLISKLLPKIKRINAIDTTWIMWRRTSPIAAWVAPKGSNPVEDLWSGHPGLIYEYDPRRTANQAPTPVYPPPYPAGALQERETQIAEMEAMAGTEQILRGERPVGVNCWVEGSELLDANGQLVEVKDVKINDEHVSMSGVGPIGAVHSREYKGDVITVNSWGNLSATTTPNHKYPVFRNNKIIHKEAKDLDKEDMVLSGYYRCRDGIEKLDVKKFGGVFDAGCGGERHGATKITNEQAEEIRQRKAKGELQQNLAKEFGISDAAVSRLVNNKTFNGSGQTRGKTLNPYIDLNENVLWLFGMYLAEGQVVRSRSDNEPAEVRWTLHKDEEFTLGERLKNILSAEFGLSPKIRQRKNVKAIDVCVSNRAFARLMINLFDTGSSNKNIHSELFRSLKSLLPIVAGWMDGDGNLDDNSLRVNTVSKTLAAQMRAICLDEKIYATINLVKTKKCNNQYKVRVTGSDLEKISVFTIRWANFISKRNNRMGRCGRWISDRLYASYVRKLSKTFYNGNVYNVTMNELSGKCDNHVNTFGLFCSQSAMMIDILRKQALASRSATLQEWDESHQELGTLLLQTTIRYVRNDPRYLERIRILAREKHSRHSIETFSGEDLSDNVAVRVDTASMALVSKEARQARMVEVLQYLPNLSALEDIGLKQAILDELGLKKSLLPSGPDVNRAKKMISLIKQGRFDLIMYLPEDDPYIFRAFLINESKSDGFIDLPQEQQAKIIELIDLYDRQIKLREQAEQQMMMKQMQMAAELEAKGKG